MATEADAVGTLIRSDAAVKALVADRVFALVMPPTTRFPLVTYQRTGREPFRTLSGASSLAASRYAIDCWGMTDSEADGVAKAVRDVVDGFVGTVVGVDLAITNEGQSLSFDEASGLFRGRVDVDVVGRG